MYEYDKKSFAQILSELRRTAGLSQRKAAADLNISQALLSHYENGAREPGLNFVCRDIARVFIAEMRSLANKTEAALEELT